MSTKKLLEDFGDTVNQWIQQATEHLKKSKEELDASNAECRRVLGELQRIRRLKDCCFSEFQNPSIEEKIQQIRELVEPLEQQLREQFHDSKERVHAAEKEVQDAQKLYNTLYELAGTQWKDKEDA